MSQPEWKCVAQLGDINPTEYGGYWVFADETGAYEPEAEKLILDGEDTGRGFAYRFSLESCTYINGILSDNRFHPDYPAWFARDIASAADTYGYEEGELIEWFLSDDPTLRALAWEAIGGHFGYENLDSYPLELSADEIEARYSEERFEVKA